MTPIQDHSNHADGNGPAKTTEHCPSCEALKAEIERLKQCQRQLEQEREIDRQTLAEVKGERDSIYRWIYAAERKRCALIGEERLAAEWKGMIENEKWYSFEEILAELEGVDKEPCT